MLTLLLYPSHPTKETGTGIVCLSLSLFTGDYYIFGGGNPPKPCWLHARQSHPSPRNTLQQHVDPTTLSPRFLLCPLTLIGLLLLLLSFPLHAMHALKEACLCPIVPPPPQPSQFPPCPLYIPVFPFLCLCAPFPVPVPSPPFPMSVEPCCFCASQTSSPCHAFSWLLFLCWKLPILKSGSLGISQDSLVSIYSVFSFPIPVSVSSLSLSSLSIALTV